MSVRERENNLQLHPTINFIKLCIFVSRFNSEWEIRIQKTNFNLQKLLILSPSSQLTKTNKIQIVNKGRILQFQLKGSDASNHVIRSTTSITILTSNC